MEGHFYMFNIFELISDYDKDRMHADRYNDQEKHINQALTSEQEDAE
jgi:hypothetical protein